MIDPARKERLVHLRGEVVRFLQVGGVAALIDLIAYLLYDLVMPTDVAKALSFITGAAFAFYGHRHRTFRRSENGRRAVVVFCVLYVATLALNVAANAGVLALLGGREAWQIGLAWFLATALSSAVNFVGGKLLIFTGRSLQRDPPSPNDAGSPER